MSAHTGKYICRACNRPFDPSSPGATAHMGPTCAKRALFEGEVSQLSLLGEEENSSTHRTGKVPPPAAPFRPNSKKLPASLTASYIKARNAFAELYRLYCANGSLRYGDDAKKREAELNIESREPYTLQDALLPWLEPEQDICMTIDEEREMIYVSRTLNEVPSFLEISFNAEGPAHIHRDTIIAHNLAVRDHSQVEDEIQLSLF